MKKGLTLKFARLARIDYDNKWLIVYFVDHWRHDAVRGRDKENTRTAILFARFPVMPGPELGAVAIAPRYVALLKVIETP